SMVANFTASGKRRRGDDMTPGGRNDRRPDRAVLVYSHLIRRCFKQTRPIVLGGIEAGLRRISHFDAWSDRVRRSILFDAKADYLLYGMADRSVVELAQALARRADVHGIRGLCYISQQVPMPDDRFTEPDVRLPDHQQVCMDKAAFSRMFQDFYHHADPLRGSRLIQRQDTRYLIHNPPPLPPSARELDGIYELPYARDVHPIHQRAGRVKALDTIQFSLTTHRGCFGECRFCAIAVHQGRQVVSRSRSSIVREARAMVSHPNFKGIISDVGGPTANMYGLNCRRAAAGKRCGARGCLFPHPCKQMAVDHTPQVALLTQLRQIPGIRRVFVGSGVRYDLIMLDRTAGVQYLETLLRHHVSGQLKIAPEHVHDPVLRLMGKPDPSILKAFLARFEKVNARLAKPCYLTYYFMAAHPGCTLADMRRLRTYAESCLHLMPEQVQIFTPSPATYSTLMYYTGIDPFSGQALFVEKRLAGKTAQKAALGNTPRRKERAGGWKR
ncbi:MAG: YgiQ family radical SAM protein, partial [Desulfatitalea sp.]|nr:YgiQ family radical SAM protein [Desulfatitalea sp.]NNK00542.1 YgiQ family radical SAM protein [Desulfatitalea sp.]